MKIFHSKKEKRIFGIYLILSFLVLLWGLFVLDNLNPNRPAWLVPIMWVGETELYASLLVVFIPLTYFILFGFVVMRLNMYRAHKKRYQSFYDLDKEEQKETLGKVFCAQCYAYHSATFTHEKMIDGMRWVYCKCSNCKEENKVRLS